MSAPDARLAPGAPVDVVVLDARDDHRELMAEVLEPAFAGNVWLAECPWSGLGRPRVLVVSLQGEPGPVLEWLDALGGPPPAVVALTGPDRRWSIADERRLSARRRLDKRAGTGFLEDLVAMVREALEAPAPLEPMPGTPEPAAQPSAPSPRATDATAPAPADTAGTPVLEVLAAELRERTAYLASATEQLGRRLPADESSRIAMAGLEREARRCQALTHRLAAMLERGEAEARRPRRVRLCDLVELREDAWRLWAGTDERLLVRGEPTSLKGWVHPDTMGPALDAVVRLALDGARASGGRAVVRCDGVLVDETMASARPGLAAGRHARLRVEVEPETPDGAVRFPAASPWVRAMLIASAKADRGFYDDRSAGEESRAVAFYVPITPPPAEPGPSGEKPWVAVVDDEAAMREIGSAVVEEAGAEASALSSGEALLQRVRAGCRYALVLLDLTMPDLDGRATYRELRAIDRSVAVVIVSGADAREQVRELLDEGALGFLRKPFDVPRLMRVIQCASGRPAEPQEASK
jgi:CheY-like chemotaxis protein